MQAAFGGIDVLRRASFFSQHFRWDGSLGCEHWNFCLEAGFAGQFVACPHLTPLALHHQLRRCSEGYVQRRKRELKQLWRQAIG